MQNDENKAWFWRNGVINSATKRNKEFFYFLDLHNYSRFDLNFETLLKLKALIHREKSRLLSPNASLDKEA